MSNSGLGFSEIVDIPVKIYKCRFLFQNIIKSKFCEMNMGIVHYNRLNNVLIFSQLFEIRGSYIFNIMTTGPIYILAVFYKFI